VARVVVRFLARSDWRVGLGLHAGRVEVEKGAPLWCGCMPPAWRSALSPAGLGESGGMLVTAGQLRAPPTVVWLLLH
jgi:hypothetical protein